VAGRPEARGRELAAAALLAVWLGGCAAADLQTPTLVPTAEAVVARATPSGPTPSLPLARAVTPAPTVEEGVSYTPVAKGAPVSSLLLTSAAFGPGGALPGEYSCDGNGGSPPLTWSGVPRGTRALSLVEEDADVSASGNRPFTQWLLYNLPAGVTQLDAGVQPKALLANGAQQGLNSGQTIGYAGACPNHGDPPHHYTFQLYAQNDYLILATGATPDEVHTALNGHVIAQAQLTVTLQR